MSQAIRIKLSKDNSLNINNHELRLMGVVEYDANCGRIGFKIENFRFFFSFLNFNLERNHRSNDASEIRQQQTNSNDSLSNSVHRQQEPGIIRYEYDGTESTIQYLSTNLSNTSALYCGDKVRF